MRTVLSFDDVLLVPQYNEVESRSDVNLDTHIGGLHMKIPIIASNMPSVCEGEMAIVMGYKGGLGIIHRMQSIKDQAMQVAQSASYNVGGAIGIGDDWQVRTESILGAQGNVICLDVAHGHQEKVHDVALEFLDSYPDVPLIVGNYATAMGVDSFLYQVDKSDLSRITLKVGVGGGSVCTTRVRTGCGIPTFQSIMDIYELTKIDYPEVSILCDGGCRNSGDIVKALAAGADAIMTGSLLAGTEESPGEVIKDDRTGRKYKVYRGAASYGAKKAYFGEADYVEGAERLIPYRGEVYEVVDHLLDGIRSGLTYCGVDNLHDLRKNADFVRVTSAGYNESLPHGLFE